MVNRIANVENEKSTFGGEFWVLLYFFLHVQSSFGEFTCNRKELENKTKN
jgi:hypothetical protein